MIKPSSLLVIACLFGGCSPVKIFASETISYAEQYIGLHERTDRAALKELTGVDPVRTEWCAAFVNAVLEKDGIPGSESVSDNPLLARSFLDWGTRVERADIQRGDVVVFPRGNQGWQGHVGFYIGTEIQDNREVWIILGGNQNNTVSYAYYSPSYALGIRRYHSEPSPLKNLLN